MRGREMLRTAIFLLLCLSLCTGQRFKEGRRRGGHHRGDQQQQHRGDQQLQHRERERSHREDEGLFPSVLNLASRALISSNATCGEHGPEKYCKLVEHGSQREPQCGVCDARARDPARRHPPELCIDGSNRWWQSPSLQQGSRYQWVTLTLDLRQVFEVAYVIVKSGISPRPGNWILERSVDGVNFTAWQYYALDDSECLTWFGVPSSTGRPTYRSDTEVICTSYYSKLDPFEGGEIHTSLINGRPGANESSLGLREFTRARYVRLRLQRVRTLHADLMGAASGGELGPDPSRGDIGLSKDASVTQRYFYSIKDISIGGQCVCHGHASDCPLDKETGIQKCRCRHNTCGHSCEHCCPLYNQVAWRPGTVQDAARCEACQCHGHADSCRFDPEVARNRGSMDTKGEMRGGGVCFECRDHTMGNNCEQCADGYFRPPGVTRNHPTPCRPCQCHRSGCPSGRCASVADDGQEQAQLPGQCYCRPGFSGRQCDKCAPGYRGFPECEPCPCSLSGSVLDEPGDCEQHCRCKANVEGEKCDQCKSGYFALEALNSEGCMACFCSGVPGATCKEASLSLQLGELGEESGWQVTDLEQNFHAAAYRAGTGALVIAADDLPGREQDYFWLAPPLPYLADLLTSYGQQLKLQLSWTTARGDTSGRPTLCADLVLVGDGMTIGQMGGTHLGSNATLAVTLREPGWQHMLGDNKGRPVSRTEFLRVLAGLKNVMIRAKFHTDQIEGRLALASLERGASEGEGPLARHIEQCVCPPGYAGLSCEKCEEGFRRANNTLQGGLCLPCDCNGHAPTCDPFSGVCGQCQHNTEGATCDRCLPGYYGDATERRPDSCRQCACPLEGPESNNVSPTCNADLSSPQGYVCNACAHGYEGVHCERCSPGFWGNPLQTGSVCAPCECQQQSSGQGPSCDPLTGRCLRCRGNTAGWRCETCLPGHYGSPEMADCRPCKCDPEGADGNSCDAKSGQCTCRPMVTGRACDRCETGRGGISAGCPLCQCHPEGSESSQCDPRTGQCPCKSGVGGKKCDTCLPNHFQLTWEGCKRCGCDVAGSEGAACDIVSGQCPCRPNVIGRACNQCKDGFWDLSSRRGCQACSCDPVGCEGTQCDISTGQCKCRTGVSGRSCDRCKHGYFGFSTSGCKECEPCNKPGHICDPDTGRCVCPSLSEGTSCERCRTGAWGHEVGVGCKPCGCHNAGSMGVQCEARSGICPCRPGFHGPRCDKCQPGHYGFPRCRACECHIPGTRRESCPFGQPCGCDDVGQCQCKTNVVGKKCEHCRRGTFSLQSDNPQGCTPCFCFGRATQCTQAQLVWSQARMLSSRSVSIEYDSPQPQFRPGSPILPVSNTQEICYINLVVPGSEEKALTNTDGTSVRLNVTNNLRIIPGDAGNVRIGVSYLFDTPLYWQLPRNFFGDKVMSYNGYLRFTTVASGGLTLLPTSVLDSYPLVQIQGNNKLVLEYFAPQTSPTGQYQVRFHEAWWRAKHSPTPGPVTRETIMLALQNVQHILIRATDSVDFTRLELRDVSLDVAVAPRATQPGTSPATVPAWQLARGVEQCECPPEYRASSCQNPAIGFYRWLPPTYQTESTIVIQLVGESRPCSCNTRSRTCHAETGACQNCTDNTAGLACDRCASGYFGDPAQSPCRPCPCPNAANNRAVSCIVGRELQCRCQPGYTGPRCERCAYGFFGYPMTVGGSCLPCECDMRGSVSDECHEETGQCNCRPGVEGRDCTLCPPRHVLGEKGCTTCNDGCTGVLLTEIQTLSVRLAEINVTGLTPAPWGRLNKLDHMVKGPLRKGLDTYLRFMNTELPVGTEEELRRRARQLLVKSKRLDEEGSKSSSDAGKTKEDAQHLLDEIKEMQSDSRDSVSALQHYGSQGESMTPSVNAALREAGLLLDKITSVNMSKPRKNAERALKKAREQLESLQDLLSSGEMAKNTGAVQEKLKNLLSRLADLEKHTSAANEALDQSSRMNKYNSAARDTTKEVLPRIKEQSGVESEAAMVRDHLNNEANALLQEAKENFEELSQIVMEVDKAARQIEHREGILGRLNPLYARQYVNPATEHAAELMRQAREYNDRFNATREVASFALKAAQAYQGIVNAIEGAMESAKNARLAGYKAYETASPSGINSGEDALVTRAKAARRRSEQLSEDAQAATRRVDGLKQNLERHKDAVGKLGDRLAEAGEKHDAVIRDLDLLDSQVGTVTFKALETAAGSSEQVRETSRKVDQIQDKINTDLKPVLHRLASENSPALAMAATHIDQARQDLREAGALATSLQKQAATQSARFAQWNDTLSVQLQQLRDSIAQARHAANGIRLSLGSTKGSRCIRSYKAHLEPSTTTNIVVTFAPSRAGDGVILLLRADPELSKDFLALELKDKRVKLTWDLGGGPGHVTHPLPVRPAGNLANDSSWVRAEVQRTGNIARLFVRPVVSPASEWGEAARNASPAGFGRFDTGPDATLWLGGYSGPSSALPEGLVPTSMPGCIHQVWLDEQPLGLWDFLTSSGPDACQACIEGAEEIRDEQAYTFLGHGYSVLHYDSSAPYNPYQFSVSMAVKTFDEDALLFLAINPTRDRFITVSLRGGRVHFRVEYGGGARLELVTSQRYNTGETVRLEAARFFDRKKRLEKGLLRVGDEEPSGAPSPPPGAGALPDLAQGQYLVGGAPPGFLAPATLPPPELRSFRGCISDIQVVNEGYNLLRGTYYAVEPGCSGDIVREASFIGDGYLELAGQTLTRKSSLNLVFATLQPEALLLLSQPVYFESGQASFYSVSLLRGQLHVRVGAGKGNTTVRSGATFNDGKLHAVSLIKTNRRLELVVDDKSISAGKLAEGSALEVKAQLGKGLFLGGLPPELVVNSSRLTASLTPLIGLIKDVVVADNLVSFSPPVRFSRVGIGRASLPAPSPNTIMSVSNNGVRSLPETRGGPTHCEPSRVYSVEPGAVKFGDKPHSHVTLQKLWLRNGMPKNFSLIFDFRTHYPNGLLFLLPAFRPKQRHYMLVALRNSHLEVTLANAKREFKLRTKSSLNDGEWHTVDIQKVEQQIRILVDGVESDKKKAPKKLNVLSTAYVGGLPETNSIAPLAGSQGVEDFKGCVRGVKVSGKSVDLVSQRGYSYNVGQCFPRVETGSFFPGDAFAIYQNNFQVGTMLELELEFRTSELSGVLLSVSEPLGYPALSLELLDGQVVLSGDMGNRKPFRVQQSFSSKFTACDNRWHQVQAFYINDALLLRVDQQTANYGHSINGGLKASRTNSSLYIGGLPDSAASGTLQTRDNFKGCIRNVAINGERRDWTDMTTLHNVLLSACPLSAH